MQKKNIKYQQFSELSGDSAVRLAFLEYMLFNTKNRETLSSVIEDKRVYTVQLAQENAFLLVVA